MSYPRTREVMGHKKHTRWNHLRQLERAAYQLDVRLRQAKEMNWEHTDIETALAATERAIVVAQQAIDKAKNAPSQNEDCRDQCRPV
jgi:hypothetical protein